MLVPCVAFIVPIFMHHTDISRDVIFPTVFFFFFKRLMPPLRTISRKPFDLSEREGHPGPPRSQKAL
jgi:hypothetical protein